MDIAGPRDDGSFAVAAAGRLFAWSRAGVLKPFARGPGGYVTATGPEPYITIAGNDRVAGTGCSFRAGTIFALQPRGRPGIIAIGPGGRAGRFASLPGTLTPTGITFDTTGHFGHALLVTARGRAATAVLAIDCTGRTRTITAHAPAMEGGIAVAPASFGRHGGDLVAAGETSGRIFAVAPDGAVVTLAASGLPRGGDIGVESTGFVPPGFGARDAAYLAARFEVEPHDLDQFDVWLSEHAAALAHADGVLRVRTMLAIREGSPLPYYYSPGNRAVFAELADVSEVLDPRVLAAVADSQRWDLSLPYVRRDVYRCRFGVG